VNAEESPAAFALFEGGGSLSSGAQALPCRALRPLFHAVRAELAAAGLGAEDRVELACENDVASAAALLFFLTEGWSVLVAPQVRGTPPLARHTAARARAVSTVEGGVALEIYRNPAYAPDRREVGVALSTSGSTGKPKLSLFRHAALFANARACVSRLGLRGDDRVAVPVPIFHMYGLGAALVPAVLAGASVDLQSRSNAMRFIARERAFDPTVAFLTPTYAHGLLAVRHEGRPYRATVLAGDRVSAAAFERYEDRHGPVCALYGSTELGAVAASGPLDPRELRVESAGKALDGVELALRSREGSAELWVRHAARFDGYLDDGGSLVAPALEDGWLPTRDHAELLPDGRVRLLGRADDAVKRDGVLVRLPDIEAALAELPFVERVAVVKGGLTPRGAGLAACIVAREGAAIDAAAARRAAQGVLPGHAVPDRFILLAELPMLGTGKIDRSALRTAHANPS
jgi:acyl-CoA synthetase (AMP-forming)/AMP-acid ligase II